VSVKLPDGTVAGYITGLDRMALRALAIATLSDVELAADFRDDVKECADWAARALSHSDTQRLLWDVETALVKDRLLARLETPEESAS
jgi:hypothetical protein